MSYLKVICCGCGGHEFTAKVNSGQMLLTCTKCDDWRMVGVHITPGSH